MSVSDIRLLKEIETALRESEQRFRDYAEMASDWFWATGPEHEFTYFSEQVGAFGGDEATPIGKRRWDIAADLVSEPGKWREHRATLDRHEPFRDFVYSSRRADGSLDFVSISGKPVFDAGGRFAGYRGVARDITKRTRAEAGLRRSEAYLAEAQRLSRTGSWAYNRATREITYWTDETYRLLGFDPAAGIPSIEIFLQRIHPEDRARAGELLEGPLREGVNNELDYRVVLPDGAVRYIHEIGHPVFDASGDLIESVGTVIDVTERKRAEEELRESERRYREMQMEVAHANRIATMGQLTASIAHEVNQPIAAAVTNAEAALRWLAGRPPDLKEVRRALGRIIKDANRAGDVISRIRQLIKKAPARKGWVDMNEAIREVIEITGGEAVKHEASVHTSLGEGLPLIEGDRVQLQQVVLNLVVNAVQAMDAVAEGPRELFVATAQAEPNAVLVTVKDSGPGLTPASLDHLFAPFHTTKPGGLGMGLSICRSIVEAHGGRLWVTANLPRGAIFHFTVAAAQSAS